MPRPKKSNRNDGRYEIKRTIGNKADGTPIKKSFYGRNRDEALKAYQDYIDNHTAYGLRNKDLLFGEWVEKWLYVYKEPDVKPTTFTSTYLRPCKNYIIPYFDGRFLRDINQMHIKEFINSISHLSQSMLDKIVLCLRGIFESAVDNEIIERNPCRKIVVKSKATQTQKRTYDLASVDKLCATTHKYSILVHILLRMGLRCSELCGLRWEDIDLESGTMSIRQALTSEGATVYIGEPKSETSKRRIPIPQDLLERLRQAPGTGYLALVNGKHMTPTNFVANYLEAFYNAVGVPREQRLTTHELRHTCGTLLYQSTRDIYYVSRFLGHSDINITTKIYVHSEFQDTAVHIDFEKK